MDSPLICEFIDSMDEENWIPRRGESRILVMRQQALADGLRSDSGHEFESIAMPLHAAVSDAPPSVDTDGTVMTFTFAALPSGGPRPLQVSA